MAAGPPDGSVGEVTLVDADAPTASVVEAFRAAPPGPLVLRASGTRAADQPDPHTLLLLLELLASPAHLVIAAVDAGPEPASPVLLAADLVVAHPDARFAPADPASALALSPALQDRAGAAAVWRCLLDPLGITASTARDLDLVDDLAPAPLPIAVRRAEAASAWQQKRPGAIGEVKALLRSAAGTDRGERSRRARLATDAIERLGQETSPEAGTS